MQVDNQHQESSVKRKNKNSRPFPHFQIMREIVTGTRLGTLQLLVFSQGMITSEDCKQNALLQIQDGSSHGRTEFEIVMQSTSRFQVSILHKNWLNIVQSLTSFTPCLPKCREWNKCTFYGLK